MNVQAKHLHHAQEGGGPLISSTPATAKETSSVPEPYHHPQRKCGIGHQGPDQATIELTSSKKIPKKSVDSIVEAFLDENTEFLDDYVRRKVSRRQLEQWLFLPFAKEERWTSWLKTTFTTGNKSTTTAGNPNPNPRQQRIHCISDSNLLKTGGLFSCVRGRQASEQRQRSRSFTPLRKLSATTFEAGGLATPILATTLDGQPSFLRTSPAAAAAVLEKANNLNQEKELNLGQQQHSISNRQDLLLSIVPNTIMQANDVPTFAKALMKSANLILGQAALVEFVLLSQPNRLFNGTVYSMTSSSSNIVSQQTRGELKNSLMTSALTSSQLLNVKDKFDENKQSYLNNALVGPLFKSETGETIGGLQLSDKANAGFTPEDVQLFQTILSLASACLSTLLSQMELRLELSRSEVFLELARTVFSEPTLGLESTMLTILTNFLSLIDCERCQVSLSDRTQPQVFKRVFDLHRNDLVAAKEILEAPYEDRLPMRSDLTGMVVQSGQKINLHGQELKSMTSDDEDCLLRSFLCLPIRDPDANIVGVISLANKDVEDCLHFTSNDERFVEAFAVFCGMSIRNAADYEKAVLSEAKMQVAFEVMNYQVSANTEEATHHLAALPVPAAAALQIDSFHFSYLSLDDNATLTGTIRMFMDLGLNSRFGIDHQTLCRWLLTVRRNYRNETVPYHNWYHAFNVAQMMFSMLLETQWNKTFSMTDILGLMVSCISHDLDHRGTNNSFQQKMNNPLAKLYTTSTLERHHLNQCLLLLALRGNNILDNLSKDEYADTLDVIEHCILATDLALHFRHAPAISNLALQVKMEDHTLTAAFLQQSGNRELVQAAMMTAADLGHSTKPWEVHQHVSHLAAEEFWHQGDLERDEFNTDPPPLLDRKVALEQVQIQFLDDICLSLYTDMSRFSSALEPLLQGCIANRQRWINLKSSNQADSRSETGEEHARNL